MMSKCPICGKISPQVKGLCQTCYSRENNRAKKGIVSNKWENKQEMVEAAFKTAQKQADIVSMAIAGVSYEAIGQKYGVSRQAIYDVISKLAGSNAKSEFQAHKKIRPITLQQKTGNKDTRAAG